MKLYALCDQEMLDKKGVSLEDFLQIAISKNAQILQYRNKKADISFMKQQLIKIRKKYDGLLIVNDAYKLIEFCDGVHLGQEDLMQINHNINKAIHIVRATITEDKILGISTHNEKEVIAANDMNINYIGLGAFRDTQTKKEAKVLGNALDDIAFHSKHPVAAIGGVRLDDVFKHITYHVVGSSLVESI